MSEKIVIIGSGGHALSCLDVINSTGHFQCVGYVDIQKNESADWREIPYLGNDESYPKLVQEGAQFCLAVGQIKDSSVREKIVEKVKSAGGKFPVIVAPTAYISKSAQLDLGTIVMHGAYVGPSAQVGKFNILNTKSIVEHGVATGDFVHISTAAVVNGDAKIGARSFIGSNSVIRQTIVLPVSSFIQAGVFVNSVPVGGR